MSQLKMNCKYIKKGNNVRSERAPVSCFEGNFDLKYFSFKVTLQFKSCFYLSIWLDFKGYMGLGNQRLPILKSIVPP